MAEIKKVIIPIAGLGTRFLPLSRVVPKEVWPLVDKPIIQYIVEEAKAAGIKEIVFVISSEKKSILDYFRSSSTLEKILKERKKTAPLEELKKIQELCRGLKFSTVLQKTPLGDGHAILQAQKIVGDEPCGNMWGDDVFISKEPCLLQVAKIFKTCQKPVLGLQKMPKEKLPAYGVAEAEKIANRLYKIKKIIEKPSIEKASSNLVICGRYILTPEVFQYLKKAEPSEKGEIILAEVFDQMLKDGKVIYGYELDGKWLECGNKEAWLKSHLYLSLKDPKFGPGLKEFLKGL